MWFLLASTHARIQIGCRERVPCSVRRHNREKLPLWCVCVCISAVQRRFVCVRHFFSASQVVESNYVYLLKYSLKWSWCHILYVSHSSSSCGCRIITKHLLHKHKEYFSYKCVHIVLPELSCTDSTLSLSHVILYSLHIFSLSAVADEKKVQRSDILRSDTARYVILDFVGQGCYGKVAKCVNLITSQKVALKILKTEDTKANKREVDHFILLIIILCFYFFP